MQEKIKTQKGFIQIPILIAIIAFVVVSGTTAGVALYKQRQYKDSLLSANVSGQIVENNKNNLNTQEQNTEDSPNIDLYKFVNARNGLNFRNMPTANSNNVLRTLGHGTKVKILQEQDNWTQTLIDGQEGWVASKYLSEELTLQIKEEQKCLSGILCNGICWTDCLEGRFHCPSEGNAVCLIDDEGKEKNQGSEEKNRISVERQRQEEIEKVRIENERLRQEAEEAKKLAEELKRQQETQQQLEAQRLAEERQRQEELKEQQEAERAKAEAERIKSEQQKNISDFMTSVGEFICSDQYGKDDSIGSAVLWKVGNKYAVFTNRHVFEGKERCILTIGQSPDDLDRFGYYSLETLTPYTWNSVSDFGFFYLSNEQKNKIKGNDHSASIEDLNYSVSELPLCVNKAKQGNKVYIIGYPQFGVTHPTIPEFGRVQQSNRLVNEGIVSGYADSPIIGGYIRDPNYFVSNKIDSGNSGGIALSVENDEFCVLGMPTWLNIGNYETQGIVQNIRNIFYSD